MVATNERALPHKSRLGFLRRKSKDELREQLKKEVEKESYLDCYVRSLGVQAEKLLTIPYFVHEIKSTAERIQYAEIVSKEFGSNGFENPLDYVLGIGSFFRQNIGHAETLKTIRDNINASSFEDFFNRFYEINSVDADFDGFLILKNMQEKNKNVVSDAFRRLLPPSPERLKDFYGSYEFHEDCIKTENEFQELIIKSTDPTHILKTHEKEILDKDPKKEVVPVVLWQNPRVNPQLKTKIDERIAEASLRHYERYLADTWIPYVQCAKEAIPEKFREIIGSIEREANASSIEASTVSSLVNFYNGL